ncbi:glycosyltransferase family 21 protein [Gelatoporia subvermispora B]|uniref:Ceramide glucosyltransferase n=1 Tax=Ceriporiopsis subvermispora (strain B) TaxID=914234 RepID=M2RBX3_CERS8|nr:glycosyltransferase family 21 protein [Gelatoporia subvermispora B]
MSEPLSGNIATYSSNDVQFALPKLVLSSGCLLWYTFIWSLSVLGCRAARKRYRLQPRSPLASASRTSAPGVSILRPLKGLDTNLYENLESTFTQEYSNFEIFLCVADEHDQALGVVRDLISKYPNVDAHVIIGMSISWLESGSDTVGVNPKVNNLMCAYKQAKHDILWVLDSNVMVVPGTLARSVDALIGPPNSKPSSRRIGLVHHVPFAWATEYALGSRLEEAFLNTNHAKMYLAINAVAIDSCVVGKSNLYRRSDLERVDGSLKPSSSRPSQEGLPGERGLAAFGRFLAEDNMIAGALWHELGLRHDLSCDVARNAVGSMTLSAYVWRRVRWVRVRKRMVFAATMVEPLTESILLGGLTSLALHHLAGVPHWLFLSIHFTLWLIVDLDVFASLAGYSVPAGSRLSFISAWSMRELLALPIWLLAILGNEVEWRGRRYEVLRNGEVRRVGNSNFTLWEWLTGRTKPQSDYYEPLDIAQD